MEVRQEQQDKERDPLLQELIDLLQRKNSSMVQEILHPDYCLCDECAAFRYAVTGEPD
jgi:hypothetical protein